MQPMSFFNCSYTTIHPYVHFSANVSILRSFSHILSFYFKNMSVGDRKHSHLFNFPVHTGFLFIINFLYLAYRISDLKGHAVLFAMHR